MYDLRPAEERCPGREHCEIFLASADGICPPCPGGLPHTSDDLEIGGVVDQVQVFIQEQQAGMPLRLEGLPRLVWKGILIWHETVAAHERAHQSRVTQLFSLVVELVARNIANK